MTSQTKFKIKPSYLADFFHNWHQLELKLEEEKYFPPEEVLSPARLERKIKKLNYLDKR